MVPKGIYCPITTPFVGEKIAVNKLADNFEKWNTVDLAGYVVFGSTGEAAYLAIKEKLEFLQTVRSYVREDKALIIGTGHESTAETIEFTKRSAEIGPEAALVLTPHYYKPQMSDDCLMQHFVSVAEHSPIPIILYNMPVFTGIDMSVKSIEELSTHPNIIGIKDSTCNLTRITKLVGIASKKFKVFIGNATAFLPALLLGVDGAVLALCNIAAKQCVQIYRRYQDKNYESARQLFYRLLPITTELVATYGIPAIKAAMDALGYYGGPPRKPLLPASDVVLKEVDLYLRKAGLTR